MNYNHKGSLAERFIKFSSAILASNDTSSEIFNALSIYVPSTLAAANLIDVDITGIKTNPVVKTVNVENYKDVLTGDLLAQWQPIFRQDTNFDVMLHIIVFYVPDGLGTDVFADYLTVSANSIAYSYLTDAFERLWPASYIKTMFSPRYDGVTPGTGYDDQNYFDLALCLAELCKNNLVLSYNLVMAKLTLPLATPDTNVCKIISKTRAEELEAATALDVVIAGVTNPRRDFFWGMLTHMQAINTWVMVHSEPYNMFPIAFAQWFEARNEARIYVGNKLEKVRLSGTTVKPTGVPSLLNSEANENLPIAQATILDEKNVSYLISIADGTVNDSIVLRAKSVLGIPVPAAQISKIIDYDVSQAIAKLIADRSSTTTPFLRNAASYDKIKEILLMSIQRFAGIGRIDNIKLNFPSFSDLPASKTDISVSAGWSAVYIYDLEKIQISGAIEV